MKYLFHRNKCRLIGNSIMYFNSFQLKVNTYFSHQNNVRIYLMSENIFSDSNTKCANYMRVYFTYNNSTLHISIGVAN